MTYFPEILLWQTQAPAVAKIWNEFFTKYPDVRSIAAVDRSTLASTLQVLGLSNQRAHALITISQWLLDYHNGEVPQSLRDLLAIPFVGPYTAGAVMCFAFNSRTEIVDTNVLRLISRFYGLSVKPDYRRNPQIWEIAKDLLPVEPEATLLHNYGLLDFTAQICTSRAPRCSQCPLLNKCAWGRSVHKVA